MATTFDPVQLFVETASVAATSAMQEVVKSELVTEGFSAIFVSVSGEVAKSIAGQIVGPLLAVFLKVIDPTQRKLDTILVEPLQTGVRLGQEALGMVVTTPNDERVRDQLFSSSLENLEKAFSYATTLKKTDECSKIRLVQATIAKTLNAPGAARVYGESFLAAVSKQIADLKQQIIDEDSSPINLTTTLLNLHDKSILEHFDDDEIRRIVGSAQSVDDVTWKYDPDRRRQDTLNEKQLERQKLIYDELEPYGPNNPSYIAMAINSRERQYMMRKAIEPLEAFGRFWQA